MTTEENQDSQIRELLLKRSVQSFGPFFAERVINQIKSLQQEVEHELFSFFKKYQLAAIAIVLLLLSVNIMLADSLSLSSVLGFEEETTNEIVQIDLYQDLTN
jgi:hypothetical protein